MAAGDVVLGIEGVFYYGTAGSQANMEADCVRDITFSGSGNMADIGRRASRFVTEKPTRVGMSLEVTAVLEEGDAFVSAVKDAWLARTPLSVYAKSFATGDGPDFDAYVADFGRGEPLDGCETVTIRFSCTDEQRDPTWS